MGIAVADTLGIGKLQPEIERLGIVLGLGPGFDAVLHRRLGELIDQLVGRIEGGCGTLCHVGDTDAAQVALGTLGAVHQVDAVEHDGAARDAAAGPGIAHGGQADGRLAGP